MSEKIDISNLKKTDRTLSKRNDVSDGELEGVSGGYVERGGYAQGYIIQCPNCHRDQPSDFVDYQEFPQQNLSCYKCVCGTVFGVDLNGQYWL